MCCPRSPSPHLTGAWPFRHKREADYYQMVQQGDQAAVFLTSNHLISKVFRQNTDEKCEETYATASAFWTGFQDRVTVLLNDGGLWKRSWSSRWRDNLFLTLYCFILWCNPQQQFLSQQNITKSSEKLNYLIVVDAVLESCFCFVVALLLRGGASA